MKVSDMELDIYTTLVLWMGYYNKLILRPNIHLGLDLRRLGDILYG